MDVAADLIARTGAEISSVTLDYRVSLLLVEPDDPSRLGATLVIGVPFTYGDPSAGARVDAEDPRSLADCWRLLRRQVVGATADDDLNLTIAFDDGSVLLVERNGPYEAWSRGSRRHRWATMTIRGGSNYADPAYSGTRLVPALCDDRLVEPGG